MVLGGFMYSEGRPITASFKSSCYAITSSSWISSQSQQGRLCNQTRQLGFDTGNRGVANKHANSQSETGRAYRYASPTHWVIAFSTTGDRMVLQSHSAQPGSLVLSIDAVLLSRRILVRKGTWRELWRGSHIEQYSTNLYFLTAKLAGVLSVPVSA